MSDEIPDRADAAIRGWIGAVAFTLVLVGGELMVEKDGLRFWVGLALVIVALPTYLSAALWRMLAEKVDIRALSAVNKFALRSPWWLRAVFIFGLALFLSQFIQGWPFIQTPSAISSHVRLLVPAAGEPKELESKNIRAQWYETKGTAYVLNMNMIGCKAALNSAGLCEVPTRSLLLMLQFEHPTVFKNIRVENGAKTKPDFTVKAISPSYAVIYFEYYPGDQVLDIKIED